MNSMYVTESWFRAALEHVLAFFIEAGHDGVVVLEGDIQRWKRDAVVSTVSSECGINRQFDPRKLVDPALALNPRAKAAAPMHREKALCVQESALQFEQGGIVRSNFEANRSQRLREIPFR
jgi:hypothetical protein